jgi:hypothetical protein
LDEKIDDVGLADIESYLNSANWKERAKSTLNWVFG